MFFDHVDASGAVDPAGIGFYPSMLDRSIKIMVKRNLSAAGFRVVDRRWVSPWWCVSGKPTAA